MKTTPLHKKITKKRKQDNMNVKRNNTENEVLEYPALALGEPEIMIKEPAGSKRIRNGHRCGN